MDPTGENSEYSGVHADRRPYPVEGTWERYSFEVGNILFLVMGDRNDGGPPGGKVARWGIRQAQSPGDLRVVEGEC